MLNSNGEVLSNNHLIRERRRSSSPLAESVLEVGHRPVAAAYRQHSHATWESGTTNRAALLIPARRLGQTSGVSSRAGSYASGSPRALAKASFAHHSDVRYWSGSSSKGRCNRPSDRLCGVHPGRMLSRLSGLTQSRSRGAEKAPIIRTETSRHSPAPPMTPPS